MPGLPGADERSPRWLGKQLDLRSGLFAAGRDLYRRQAIEEPGRWAEALSAGSGHEEAELARYTHFEFRYSPSAEPAFLTECEQCHLPVSRAGPSRRLALE
jgi:hypothetical protein